MRLRTPLGKQTRKEGESRSKDLSDSVYKGIKSLGSKRWEFLFFNFFFFNKRNNFKVGALG